MKYLKQASLILGAGLSLALAFLILFWAGLPNPADYSGQEVPNIGYVAPEIAAIAPAFQAERFADTSVDLMALRGEPVIINFWATWCIPCRAEMPELQSLFEETGVKILAVNIAESENQIQAWVEDYGLGFDIVLDPNGEIYQMYRVRGQPSTYILDQEGFITHIFYGAITADVLRDALNSLNENG